jgi:hypothetical protein
VLFFTRLLSAVAERGLGDRNIKRSLIVEGILTVLLWTLFILSVTLY